MKFEYCRYGPAAQTGEQILPIVILIEMGIADVDRGQLALQRLRHRSISIPAVAA